MNDKARDVIGEVIAEDSVRIVPPSVAQHAVQSVAELQEVIAQRDARIEELEREIHRVTAGWYAANGTTLEIGLERDVMKAQQKEG